MSSLSMFTEVDLSLHVHCTTCIVVARCMFLNANERYGCEVIRCPNECGRLFHMCKTEEHLLLCPLTRAPCTNAGYGCPLWMCRKDINAHLSLCPASLVYCKMERNRKPINDKAKKQLKTNHGKVDMNQDRENEVDCKAIDLRLALSDQNKINESYHYSRRMRKLYTNFFCKHHPSLPIPRPVYTNSEMDDCCPNSMNYVEEGNTSEEEERKRKRITAPVARECIICKVDPSSQHLHMLGSMMVNLDENANEDSSSTKAKNAPCVPEFYTRHKLLVDLTADFLPSHYPKQRNYYTIVCNQTIRRDEHGSHYTNFHADVVAGLDGWGLVRCPLLLYGCEMYHTRLQPADDSNQITYSATVDSIVLRKNLTENPMATNEKFNLTALPFDALCTICDYLDSASMFSLSMSCQSLRQVCQSLLPQRGMVQCKWLKTLDAQGRARWVRGPKLWSYSKCFQSVPKWKVVPAHGLVDHIQKCPHYDPIMHTEPIPVLTFVPQTHIVRQH